MSEDGKASTILEGAREIPTPAAFRLWLLLSVIPARRLLEGEKRLAKHLEENRNSLRRLLRVLEDAGYVRLEKTTRDDGRSGPTHVVLLKPPMLVGDDRFIVASRSRAQHPFRASMETTDLSLRARRIRAGVRRTLLGREIEDDDDRG